MTDPTRTPLTAEDGNCFVCQKPRRRCVARIHESGPSEVLLDWLFSEECIPGCPFIQNEEADCTCWMTERREYANRWLQRIEADAAKRVVALQLTDDHQVCDEQIEAAAATAERERCCVATGCPHGWKPELWRAHWMEAGATAERERIARGIAAMWAEHRCVTAAVKDHLESVGPDVVQMWLAEGATAERERIAAALPEALGRALGGSWGYFVQAHPAVRALLAPPKEPGPKLPGGATTE